MISKHSSLQRIKHQLHETKIFLSSTPALANWIGLFTTVVWVIKAVWFDHVHELFPGANDVGRVFEGFLSAVLAGYVFYILFALLPEHQARGRLAPFIRSKTSRIVGDCMQVLHETNRNSGAELTLASATMEGVLKSFSDVDTTKRPNMVGVQGGSYVPVTWIRYLSNQQDRTQSTIRNLFEQSRYVEAELVSILAEIDNSSYINAVKMAALTERQTGQPVNNKNLSAWAQPFAEYVKMCRDLAEWHDAHRSPGTPRLLSDSVH